MLYLWDSTINATEEGIFCQDFSVCMLELNECFKDIDKNWKISCVENHPKIFQIDSSPILTTHDQARIDYSVIDIL